MSNLVRPVRFAFYNVGPVDERVDNQRAAVEFNAIGNIHPKDRRRKAPHFIGACETVGRVMPTLDGYDLFHTRRSESRANVALYVRQDVLHDPVEWWTGKVKWPNVLHPGTHPPRSTMWLPTEYGLIGVGHAPQPPSKKALTVPARSEWLHAHAQRIRRTHAVLFMSDSNGLSDELRDLCPGVRMGGTPFESVHVKRMVIQGAPTPGKVNGVEMRSDHEKCLLGRATV